ncbi:gliding motility-associated C-terminal domain-containing protein [Flavobacteriaceae bacterium TP-CH-4]|uniref:Gliding motility-associated C-terminal domain-containing protein n=2 Tax=Pelagihabitans pacificus TaxID=2696054 RepID=A0A967AUV3_9FLAO|nr:gliding motility-associated C-terminal domain-containing protein [Pelagihabitans pacificus]
METIHRRCFFGLVVLLAGTSHAQTALQNAGNLRIHENGQLGFHTDLINNGILDENQGLVGFYGDNTIDVSGAVPATFNDVEFATSIATVLRTSLNVSNNANFITGNVLTPREESTVTLNFLENAFYNGEGDINKVDGYASITQQQNFTFPVGDFQQLRPLILESQGVNAFANCAYFSEDPNNPTTFATSFDTQNKPASLGEISTREFWRLEGSVPSTIQISWNAQSDMAALTDDVTTIVPVGWSKSANQWVSLGNSGGVGDLTEGFTTSISFVPDDYEIITFGGAGEPLEALDLGNYLVTPNGDGRNDVLEIPELEQSPNNTVRIFDRFGLKVFEKDNYTDEFDGFATTGTVVINKEKGLPSGVYFYVATLHDLGLEFQGFLYLSARR